MGEPAPLRGGARGAGERVDTAQLLLAQLGKPHAAGKRHRSQVSPHVQNRISYVPFDPYQSYIVVSVRWGILQCKCHLGSPNLFHKIGLMNKTGGL